MGGLRWLFGRETEEAKPVAREPDTWLEWDEEEFTVRRKAGLLEVRWVDVEEVVAYKTDNFTYDTIWLTFQLTGGTEVYVNEESDRFMDFVKAMQDRFGIDPGWYLAVMKPAFEENRTTLYPARASD